jgi:hypothetical protein
MIWSCRGDEIVAGRRRSRGDEGGPVMKGSQSDRWAALALGAAIALGGTAYATDQPVPVEAVRGLLYSRPFTLQEPYVYTWLHDQPAITGGVLLGLAVDPEVAKPQQVDVPVLFAGDTPVHLTNSGYPSGRMIVIVPTWVDLARVPVYFGSTELPERIDRARGALEEAAASARGAGPFGAEARAAAFAAGGEPLAVRGSHELFLAVADLIDRFAPLESELAEIYRTPLVPE